MDLYLLPPHSSLKALWSYHFAFLSFPTTKYKKIKHIITSYSSNKDQSRQPTAGVEEIEILDFVWEMSLLLFPLWALHALFHSEISAIKQSGQYLSWRNSRIDHLHPSLTACKAKMCVYVKMCWCKRAVVWLEMNDNTTSPASSGTLFVGP